MDELEGVFKNNKASFDRLTPSENVWESIAKETGGTILINDSKKRKTLFILKIAATIIFIAGLTVFFTSNTKEQSPFDNLSMLSPDGKEVLLDLSLNKYTLVQFWESENVLFEEDNCYCYLPTYEKYKDRGFEIYAISLDKDKKKWVESIEKNKSPWIHVSDLKGLESPICIDCDVKDIPASFLLDQEGNIIAKDLDEEDLDITLGTLLAQN